MPELHLRGTQRRDTVEMRLVQPVDRTERQADRVDGEFIILAQALDGQERRRVREIVLGMDLEKAGRRPVARAAEQLRSTGPK